MSARREPLFYAAGAFALAALSRGYIPTAPGPAAALAATNAWAALVFVGMAWRAPQPPPRWAFALLLPALPGWAYMAAAGALVLHIRFPAGLPLLALEGVALGIGVFVLPRVALRRMLGTALLAHCLLYMALCAFMWRPPSPERCAAAEVPPTVTRITDPAWASEPSYPYEMAWSPEHRLLAVSFKAAANATLPIWDPPTGNRVVVLDGAGGEAVHVLPRGGELLPEYLAWHPRQRRLAVGQLGFRRHELGLFDLDERGAFTAVAATPIPFEPNAVLGDLAGQTLTVLGVNRDLGRFAWSDGSLLDYTPSSEATGFPGFIVVKAIRDVGSDRAWLAHLGTEVVELDLATRERRSVRVGPGIGEFAQVPERAQLVHGNGMFGVLSLIDTTTLAVLRTRRLGFRSRPLAVDAERDLLMVGDWFGGRVRYHRLSDLEPLGISTDVGPYLRKLAFDGEAGILYAGSKCGVYRVDVDAVFGAPRRSRSVEPVRSPLAAPGAAATPAAGAPGR